MIQMQTNLDVAEQFRRAARAVHQGAGGSKRKYASIGDTIVVSVRRPIPRGPREEGQGDEGLVVRTAKGRAPAGRLDHPLRSQRRGSGQPARRADRHAHFRPVTRELRAKKHMKIVSLAPEVL